MKRIAHLIEAGIPFRFDGRRVLVGRRTRASEGKNANKADVLDALRAAEKRVNEWSVRDRVLNYTSWGFWKSKGGKEHVSLDESTAKQVIKGLIKSIESGDIRDP